MLRSRGSTDGGRLGGRAVVASIVREGDMDEASDEWRWRWRGFVERAREKGVCVCVFVCPCVVRRLWDGERGPDR